MAENTRKIAVVTGASEGIGREFALQLAARGYDLVAVARNQARLDSLAEELSATHGASTEVLIADLMTPAGVETVAARLQNTDSPIDLLVNNAGFGTAGKFADLDVAGEVREIQCNVLALVQLTHAALGGLVARRRGGVINVGSIAAYQPNPTMATYGATKAFVYSFTQAIHEELHGTRVKAMVLCPGFTRTEFQTRAGVEDSSVPGLLWQSAHDCVSAALRDYDRGRAVCVPGAINTLGTAFTRVTPSVVTRKVAARVMNQ